MTTPTKSDGSTASYYELPEGSTELQHLISHRNMNMCIGSIFKLCYNYALSGHKDMKTIKEILFYAEHEISRIENMQQMQD